MSGVVQARARKKGPNLIRTSTLVYCSFSRRKIFPSNSMAAICRWCCRARNRDL